MWNQGLRRAAKLQSITHKARSLSHQQGCKWMNEAAASRKPWSRR